MGGCGLDSAGSGWGSVAGCCEHALWHGKNKWQLFETLNTWAHPASFPVSPGALTPGIKRPAREADHLLAPSS